MIKRGRKIKLRGYLTVFLTTVFWIALVVTLFFLKPETWLMVVLFFALLFAALGLTFLLIFKKPKPAILFSLYFNLLLFLQVLRQLHWLNIILLSAFFFTLFFWLNGS